MTAAILVTMELALFFAVLVMIEIGYRVSLRGGLDASSKQTMARKTVTGVVQTLIGLILAFSFAGAASRLEANRRGILEEANAVGMAWERADLANEPQRKSLQDTLGAYLESRIDADESLPNMAEYERHVAIAHELQTRIWRLAIESTGEGSAPQSRILLLPAINTMTDAESKRTLAVRTHMTELTLLFIVGLVMVSSILAGTALSEREGRSWLYRVIFALVMSTALHVIIDMEYPRLGLDGTREADRFMRDLRQRMK